MAFYFQIHAQIWHDPWVFDLPLHQKLLFIYLFSNPRADLTGLYEIPLRLIAVELDMEEEQVREGLAAFERAGKVLHSGSWVWVPNMLRYNAANVKSPKTQQHLRSRLEAIPDMPLKQQWLARYGDLIGDAESGSSGPTAEEPEAGLRNGVSPAGSPEPDAAEGPCRAPSLGTSGTGLAPDTALIPHPAEASAANGASMPHPSQQQQQQQEHCHATDQPLQQKPITPKGGKTESAGADGGRPPSGAGVGEKPEWAETEKAPPVPASFDAWQVRLRDSPNRPATLRAMFEVLYPGRDPPSYGHLGRVARDVGGAGRLAELLWQHSTRPPTGDVLAYIQAVVQRERQRLTPAPMEPAGFAGIREWMRQEGLEWQPDKLLALIS